MSRAAESINKEPYCEGKVVFRTFARAAKSAARKNLRQPYHCQHCNAFHVGSFIRRPKSRPKEVRR